MNFKLAFRNTFRNRRRTFLTLLSIGVGVAAIVLYQGFVAYSMWGLQESTIRNGLGHLQIATSEDYFETGEYDPYKFLMSDYKETAEVIASISKVKGVIPKISFPATLASGDKSGIGMIHATPSSKSFELLSFRHIVRGRDISESHSYEIIIGQGLAKKLNVKVNDTITLMGVMKGGGLNAMDITVVGIASSGIRDIDNFYAYIDLETAKAFLGIESVPQLIILLEKTEYLTNTYTTIMQKINFGANKKLVAKKWMDLSDYYMQVKTFYQNLLDVVQFIVVTIVIFTIVNTMTMSVLERVRETGTLRTLGAKKKTVIAMFLQEAAIIGFVGGLAGVGLGLLLSLIINQLGGIYIPPPPGMSEGYFALFKPPSTVLFEAFGLAFFISIIGAILPAIKSIRYSIADSLRHV